MHASRTILDFHIYDPQFPLDEHGAAMKKRIQKFLPIKPVVSNMGVFYRQQAIVDNHHYTIIPYFRAFVNFTGYGSV